MADKILTALIVSGLSCYLQRALGFHQKT